MGKVVIIGGNKRAGKTTLSLTLHKEYNWVNFNKNEYFLINEKEYPKTLYCWTIWQKDKNIPIGGINVHHQEDDYFHCELGYSIHPNFWNEGYMSEAVIKVLDFLINEVGYERVSAECTFDNISSKRVMEKSGMTFEGIKRKSYYKNNQFYDKYLYSKIRDDYKK